MTEKQKEFKGNASRYREASQPHESPEAAKEAISAFYKELGELRVKHRMKDLYVIYNVGVIESDGTETVSTGMSGFGTHSLFEAMTACAYGSEKRNREENIRRMLAD